MSRSIARLAKACFRLRATGFSYCLQLLRHLRSTLSRTYNPTFLRWHNPDQVRRDQGNRFISAHKGAPSGFPVRAIPHAIIFVNQIERNFFTICLSSLRSAHLRQVQVMLIPAMNAIHLAVHFRAIFTITETILTVPLL